MNSHALNRAVAIWMLGHWYRSADIMFMHAVGQLSRTGLRRTRHAVIIFAHLCDVTRNHYMSSKSIVCWPGDCALPKKEGLEVGNSHLGLLPDATPQAWRKSWCHDWSYKSRSVCSLLGDPNYIRLEGWQLQQIGKYSHQISCATKCAEAL